MSVIISDGPRYSVINGPDADDINDLAFLRILTFYHVETDSLALRIDVKYGENQANGVCFGWEKSVKAGNSSRSGPLLMPNKGIEGGYAVMADRKTLAAILRGLAEKLDG